jgi:hypothetical protein
VCREVQGQLRQTNANTLTTYTTFICGKEVYKVDFQILIEIPEENYEAKGLKFIENNFYELVEKGSLADIKFVFKDDRMTAHSVIVPASSSVLT